MVKKSFEEIFDEANKTLQLQHPVAFVEHAKGYVPLGGISVVIAVACKHRAQVYEFSRYIIEEIKKRTPIWKKEHYANEKTEWLKGTPIQK
jgi:molybdopterin synthase catalytic subunit